MVPVPELKSKQLSGGVAAWAGDEMVMLEMNASTITVLTYVGVSLSIMLLIILFFIFVPYFYVFFIINLT
jgi:hypothetical protein